MAEESVNFVEGGRARLQLFPPAIWSEAKDESLPDLRAMAEEAAETAREIAPVVSGAYRDGVDVEEENDMVFLVDNDPLAFIKEYGTVDTPAHAILSDAARELAQYNDRGAFTAQTGL